jgi:hypothetical protein
MLSPNYQIQLPFHPSFIKTRNCKAPVVADLNAGDAYRQEENIEALGRWPGHEISMNLCALCPIHPQFYRG